MANNNNNGGDMTIVYRTAFADYLTILTGLFTIASGLYSLYSGSDILDTPDQDDYWGPYLRHAVAIAVTVFGLYFFLDQSIRLARRVVEGGSSALPRWLVYGMFYFGGLAFFSVFQIVFQSSMFIEMQWSYFITSLVIWLAVTIPLGIAAAFKKKPRR